ncbi:MAG: adenosylmethionine decarboxylase [Proteobacteria bacterium]|nr:adenosylmethionine decarboxylase [Pseudomonadota bacterium]MBI3496816.1 adenosylmethionine decarboxylase [Pseudomonadota bacterium]
MADTIFLDPAGMDLETRAREAKPANRETETNARRQKKKQRTKIEADDHFVTRDGMTFAGTHLIIDLWGASGLDDVEHIDRTLRRAVVACNATLLHIHLHRFEPSGGISGVAVLAESHISIHTWPERGYAALDVFMCGSALPHKAVPVLREAFKPSSVQFVEHRRGLV